MDGKHSQGVEHCTDASVCCISSTGHLPAKAVSFSASQVLSPFESSTVRNADSWPIVDLQNQSF